MHQAKSMYPKVKVKTEAEDDYQRSFYKALDSLSLHDYPSPAVKEHKDDSPPSVIRIPKSYVPKSAMPSAPVSKGSAMSISRKVLQDDKPNIRASSVPRPRAVLSSPDNDGIARSKDKSRTELLSGLKNHNSCQNRHIKCKVIIPQSVDIECRMNTRREANEVAHRKSTPKGIKGSVPAEPRKKPIP